MSDVFQKEKTFLREMTDADLPAVLTLENATFTDPWPEEFFRENMSLPYQYTLLLVSEETKEIVGYVMYSVVFDEMNIDNICVAEAFRKKHLGEALMDAALCDGIERGATVCFLEVRASNIPAISLYEKKGFIFDRLRKEYYHSPVEDGRVYHKDLSET